MIIKNQFTRCQNILTTVKNLTDTPLVQTSEEKGILLRADYENSRFENKTLHRTFWKRYLVNTRKFCKLSIFQRFQNEAKRFLRCRCDSSRYWVKELKSYHISPWYDFFNTSHSLISPLLCARNDYAPKEGNKAFMVPSGLKVDKAIHDSFLHCSLL